MEQSPYNSSSPEPKQDNTGCGPIIVILVGIVILLIASAIHSSWLAAIDMGAIMLACGVMAVQNQSGRHRKRYGFPALFLGIGTALTLDGFYELLAPPALREWAAGYRDYVLFGLIFLVGGGLMISQIVSMLWKKKICNVVVSAECVELRRSRSSRKRLYTPVWSYWYDGQQHEIHDSSYSNYSQPAVGEMREIGIDPEYHEIYYDAKRERGHLIFRSLIGLFFIGMGIFMMILTLRQT